MLLKLARSNFKYLVFHLKAFVIWALFLKSFLNRASKYAHKGFHYSCLSFKRSHSFQDFWRLTLTERLFQASLTNWMFYSQSVIFSKPTQWTAKSFSAHNKETFKEDLRSIWLEFQYEVRSHRQCLWLRIHLRLQFSKIP